MILDTNIHKYTVEQLDEIVEDYLSVMKEIADRLHSPFRSMFRLYHDFDLCTVNDLYTEFNDMASLGPNCKERVNRLNEWNDFFTVEEDVFSGSVVNSDNMTQPSQTVRITLLFHGFADITKYVEERLLVTNKEDRNIYLKIRVANRLEEIAQIYDEHREEFKKFFSHYQEEDNSHVDPINNFVFRSIYSNYFRSRRRFKIIGQNLNRVAKDFCLPEVIMMNGFSEISDSQDAKDTGKLTHPQKVLLTYYFQEHQNFPRKEGLNINDEPFNKFLSYLFGYDWKNTQLYFNNIRRNSQHNPMNVKNLQKVIEVFRELKLDELVPKIEEDLRKVQEKKIKKE